MFVSEEKQQSQACRWRYSTFKTERVTRHAPGTHGVLQAPVVLAKKARAGGPAAADSSVARATATRSLALARLHHPPAT